MNYFNINKISYPNECWMKQLPENVKKLSLINIAIPGSHNSMSYGINGSSKAALDAQHEVRVLYKYCPCFVRRWSKTQSLDVTEQLKLGVRYFDLRISLKDNIKYFFAHGLYAMEIFKPLKEIRLFLEDHPQEIVILDFQHFYGFTEYHHQQIQYNLKNIFFEIMYEPSDGSLNNATLNNCNAKKKQVLIIYRRTNNCLDHFWSENHWPTPWPNTCSIKKLKYYLNSMLKYRDPKAGYVSQCILTPNEKYIAKKFYSSLKGTAKNVDKNISNWIEAQSPGIFHPIRPTVNVLIADFVNLYNGDFCTKIINLNLKLKEIDILD